jgi:metallo-beta-lactamase family protein
MLKVKFCGAARTVTGSQYYVEYQATNGEMFRFCIDSGMFQSGQKVNLFKLNSHLLFDPRTLDALILTHAHLDHCGRIPFLVKHGFGGRIYSTTATMKIAEVVMRDAARLSFDLDNDHISALKGLKSGVREGEDALLEIMENVKSKAMVSEADLAKENFGLYTDADVTTTMGRFRNYEYHQVFSPHPELEVEYYDAGHILGSAWLTITHKPTGKKVVFSGDYGNFGKPIIENPEMSDSIQNITHIFTETTYGDRSHGEQDPKEKIRKIVGDTLKRGGQAIIPSFSVERAQELIYLIVVLMRENKLLHVPIYLDSPMAQKILEITLDHPELYDDETRKKIEDKAHPLRYEQLEILEASRDSKRLNTQDKPCIIIAGSGMMNGGRILKHMQYHLQDEKNTLIFVGYQAAGTLGRKIWDGERNVEVEGKELHIATNIEMISEFSAHADQGILKEWVSKLILGGKHNQTPTVFLMHGERSASLTFGDELKALLKGRVNTYWPRYAEEVVMWE